MTKTASERLTVIAHQPGLLIEATQAWLTETQNASFSDLVSRLDAPLGQATVLAVLIGAEVLCSLTEDSDALLIADGIYYYESHSMEVHKCAPSLEAFAEMGSTPMAADAVTARASQALWIVGALHGIGFATHAQDFQNAAPVTQFDAQEVFPAYSLCHWLFVHFAAGNQAELACTLEKAKQYEGHAIELAKFFEEAGRNPQVRLGGFNQNLVRAFREHAPAETFRCVQ